MFPIFAGNSASTGYNLTRSLRLRQTASAYLNRTPSVTGNRQKFTISLWHKRGKSNGSGFDSVFYAGAGANIDQTTDFGIYFLGSNIIQISFGAGTWIQTIPVYRDPAAWYHIVVAVDSTLATASDRIILYVNGLRVTALAVANMPPQNNSFSVNNTVSHNIGATVGGSTLDGYLTEVNFIDGQALTPSSFGSTNALTGVWQPARYTGSYGTNGFYLPFTDNSALTTSSNVGLGKDFSGNGNYWVTNNISITAGVTYDSMTDVPTLTSATASNFATLNPLAGTSGTISNANLTLVGASAGATQRVSTIAASSGKIYFECQADWDGAQKSNAIGIARTTGNVTAITSQYAGQASDAYALYIGGGSSNVTYNNAATTTWGATPASPVIMQIAVDLDNLKVWFGVNNTWVQGDPSAGTSQVYTILAGTYLFAARQSGGSTSSTLNLNFGQRPFAYTPPTGFVALNTYNLPTSTIVKGNTVFDATLWTGNSTGSTTQVITNAGAFKPDFLWAKSRSAAYNHHLVDSVRGVSKILYSDLTNAEVTNANGVSSFNSNGFTLGTDAGGFNDSGKTYVGWQWQAGQGTTSSNTNGTITSTVSVNASAGFSVVTYTTPASGGFTVGHGLGVAPAFVIHKSRSNVIGWQCYHQAIGNTAYINLDLTNASVASSTAFNNTSPSSSIITYGNTSFWGASYTYVAYCWTPIAGFSAFGSYTGNGSTDGTFVYTGFRPRWIMIKRSDSAGNNWRIWDTARATYNAGLLALFPNVSDAEDSVTDTYDLVSNGFKLRTSGVGTNASGGTYIYAAFAENPFKNSLAR